MCRLIVGFLLLTAFSAPATHAATHCGEASWYALDSKTASGEKMNPNAMTAAHRSLKFGTKVQVINKTNGKSVIVRINDRGPFTGKRVLDLSKAAAAKLGYIRRGHTQVCYGPVG